MDKRLTDHDALKLLSKPISVCVYHDDKAGHLAQLEGLCAALLALSETSFQIEWRSLNSSQTKRNRLAPPPDIVLGAGHATHLSVLRSARKHKAFSVLLMKPSLPCRWFDAVICPRHDGLKSKPNILNTLGPLNRCNVAPTLTHITAKIDAPGQTTPHETLIILGGPSKHYSWDDQVVFDQVNQLIQMAPKTNWRLFNSRRTPESFNLLLRSLPKTYGAHVQFFPHDRHSSDELYQALAKAEASWVTPDSASMIYESLSMQCATGLLSLSSPKASRITRGNQRLCEQGWVSDFNTWLKTGELRKPPERLNEAERAASWLLQRYAEFDKTRRQRLKKLFRQKPPKQ